MIIRWLMEYTVIWTKENYGDTKKISGCQRLGKMDEEENKGVLERGGGALYGNIIMHTNHYTHVQTHGRYNSNSELCGKLRTLGH